MQQGMRCLYTGEQIIEVIFLACSYILNVLAHQQQAVASDMYPGPSVSAVNLS
jgi:hypothetical protein